MVIKNVLEHENDLLLMQSDTARQKWKDRTREITAESDYKRGVYRVDDEIRRLQKIELEVDRKRILISDALKDLKNHDFS